jgi:N-acetylglucosaminyldiphosphoundecaprenol N-acetyl-beta-D-mannosaminyltransferase
MKRIFLFDQVPFDTITRTQLLATLTDWAIAKQKKLVLNLNAYGVTAYIKNSTFARIIDKADLIYPDGWGPVLAARLTKLPLQQRINVGDFLPILLTKLNQHRLKLFLIGTEADVIETTARRLTNEYPHIKLVGYHHGYLTKSQESNLAITLTQARPHVVMVGMGLPKQEFFLDRHWYKLPPAVYLGVGGVFHYLAGTKKRAPVWMRRFGLEWLFRLIQEPFRLGKRYTLDLLYFGVICLKSLLSHRQA